MILSVRFRPETVVQGADVGTRCWLWISLVVLQQNEPAAVDLPVPRNVDSGPVGIRLLGSVHVVADDKLPIQSSKRAPSKMRQRIGRCCNPQA